MSAPAVAVSLDGKRFAAAWKDVREGAPRVWWVFAAEPRFGEDASIADGPRVDGDHPSLAVTDRGAFWAAWEEGRAATARIRVRCSAGGGSSREVAGADRGPTSFPVVTCGGGLTVLAWEETPAAGPSRVSFRVLEDARR